MRNGVHGRLKRNAENAEEEEEDAEKLVRKIDDVAFDAITKEDDIEINQ